MDRDRQMIDNAFSASDSDPPGSARTSLSGAGICTKSTIKNSDGEYSTSTSKNVLNENPIILSREPLRFKFTGYTLWLELEQFDVQVESKNDTAKSTSTSGDLDHVIQVASQEMGLFPIPAPHMTLIYGMEHFHHEEEVLSVFRGEELGSFLWKNKHIHTSTSRCLRSCWPHKFKPKGVLSDISFDGVDGEVMDMAWSEISFETSSEDENMLDAIYKIFHKDGHDIDNDNGSNDVPPQWKPHVSLAYDNPEETVLSPEHAKSLVARYPTLMKDRKVVAISLWNTHGRIDEWKCMDRIYLDAE